MPRIVESQRSYRPIGEGSGSLLNGAHRTNRVVSQSWLSNTITTKRAFPLKREEFQPCLLKSAS
jgi:hypothetical protein